MVEFILRLAPKYSKVAKRDSRQNPTAKN